ncbi:polyprenol phosphomannose-dependent alpha 1,6 mannosyltransferase MptB, partial [Corynebacterium matruchotii]
VRLDLVGQGVWLIAASGFLISCAGMVKVTGFVGLGFTGMAVARVIRQPRLVAIGLAVAAQVLVLVLSVVVVTWVTGIGVGWISGQGGATTIRSWLSFTTAIGVSFGWIGQMLKLGDHTEAILLVTRSVGVLIAGWLMVRMLLATYLGRISPVGALGVSTFVMVVFFPVVHPWYALWAILPLSAWANRPFFRTTVVVYSTILSFFVLPRGLGLVPGTVVWIYVAAVIGFATILGVSYVILKRRGVIGLN